MEIDLYSLNLHVSMCPQAIFKINFISTSGEKKHFLLAFPFPLTNVQKAVL